LKSLSGKREENSSKVPLQQNDSSSFVGSQNNYKKKKNIHFHNLVTKLLPYVNNKSRKRGIIWDERELLKNK